MKRIYHLLFMCLATAMALYGVPAKRQSFKALMSDNTYEMITFCGDENGSYYVTEDGYLAHLSKSGDYYIKTDQKLEDVNKAVASINKRGIGAVETAPIQSIGSPKIPVILVNFSDLRISLAQSDNEINNYYDLYCNGTRDGVLYTGAGSSGAVRDYFAQQSDSLFLPEFEIIGPVTLSKEMAYYGKNSSSGSTDVNFKEFCSESLNLAMQIETEFISKFDNDNNGTVDLAFFIFAGLPESDRGVTSDAIWPKETLSATTVNGVTISVSACCSELTKTTSGSMPAGIGTMCHEISHSIGLPDLYDTNYKALGMSYWSIMDSGCYCNNGKTPCAYTTYERDFLGWRKLDELNAATTVRLKPIENNGNGYKIVNNQNRDEYYVVENRQPVGWDSSYSKLGHGMLVMHVDYLRSTWTSNRINTNSAHQRFSFIPANNSYIGSYSATSSSQLLYALNGQLYPGTSGNTELTNTSLPASKVFNGDYMNKPIKDIREWDNGDITFKFMPLGELAAPQITQIDDISNDSLEIKWDIVENGDFYFLYVHSANENESQVSEILTTDTLYNNTFRMHKNMLEEGKEYKYTVMAMNDKYLNSPISSPYLYMYNGTDIKDINQVYTSAQDGIYTIEGIRVGDNSSNKKELKKGIYIIKQQKSTKKIIIQ